MGLLVHSGAVLTPSADREIGDNGNLLPRVSDGEAADAVQDEYSVLRLYQTRYRQCAGGVLVCCLVGWRDSSAMTVDW